MNTVFRKNLLFIHTWSGLTLGLVVVFLAVTGAAFVLRPELDTLVYGNLLKVAECAQRLPLDTLVEKARQAHPGGALSSIEITNEADASTAVKFSNKDLVYVDPCSGAVLGTQNEYGGFFGIADGLHRFRFIVGGRLIAGWVNVVFLVLLIVGGIILWWPRGGQRFTNAFKFNPRLPGVARTINLHKVVGIYTCLVLLMFTISGLPIAFDPVKDLIGWAAGSSMASPKMPVSAVPADGAPRRSMEEYWQRSLALVPNQKWVSLRFPAKPTDAAAFEIVERGAPHEEAKSYLYLDAYTGEKLRLLHYPDLPRGRLIYLYLLAFHAGLIAGFPYQLLLFVCCAGIGVMAYSGFSPYLRRKFRTPAKGTLALTVVRKAVDAVDICTFELADPGGKTLPPFSAGSHLDVHLRPGLIRQYSLCNDPTETHRYLIGVLRSPESRGGSVAMHDEIQEGDVLEVSPPKNHFPLAHAATHSLLFAGGIGITPILCMAERLANSGASFALHYCTRSAERTAFLDRIKRAAYAGQVQFHFDTGDDAQKLDMRGVLATPDPDCHLYVCGPKGFMDAVIRAALDAGWPDTQIHREYFAGAAQRGENDVAFDVKIASTGKLIHVPKGKTALDVLAEHGVEVQSSCGEGVCGTCLTRVLAGEPDHRDLYLTLEDRRKNDCFLPCCSRSAGGMLVLDL